MISVGLLTFNQFKTGRDKLFRQTLASIEAEAFPHTLDIVTNGSTDRTDVVVRKLGGIVDNRNSAAWYGMERAITGALAHDPEIVVLSADDLAYHPGWMDALATFWAAAPDDIVLATLHIEAGFPWNVATESLDIGGLRALVRPSCPSASWSFRARDAHLILPLGHASPGEDHITCERLRAGGYRMVHLDLAEDCGQETSAWGNESFLRPDMIPADIVKEKWGITNGRERTQATHGHQSD